MSRRTSSPEEPLPDWLLACQGLPRRLSILAAKSEQRPLTIDEERELDAALQAAKAEIRLAGSGKNRHFHSLNGPTV